MSGRSAKGEPRQARPTGESKSNGQFAKTLVRVLGVQVITLALLWLLQTTFSS